MIMEMLLIIDTYKSAKFMSQVTQTFLKCRRFPKKVPANKMQWAIPQEFWDYKQKYHNPFFDVKESFIETHFYLGDLQEGDLELFLGEEYLNSGAFSVCKDLEKFFESYPEHHKAAIDFKNLNGLMTISDLIQYVEKNFGNPDATNEQDIWTFIFNSSTIQNFFLFFKMSNIAVKEHVDRIIRIKKKLLRMPILDEISLSGRSDGRIISSDDEPGLLHPRDSALLSIIGLFVGVVIHRSSEDHGEGLFVKRY